MRVESCRAEVVAQVIEYLHCKQYSGLSTGGTQAAVPPNKSRKLNSGL
jgi:hypothetical protein